MNNDDCPHCGRCKHCGRPAPTPYWPYGFTPYVQWPQPWYQPPITWPVITYGEGGGYATTTKVTFSGTTSGS